MRLLSIKNPESFDFVYRSGHARSHPGQALKTAKFGVFGRFVVARRAFNPGNRFLLLGKPDSPIRSNHRLVMSGITMLKKEKTFWPITLDRSGLGVVKR